MKHASLLGYLTAIALSAMACGSDDDPTSGTGAAGSGAASSTSTTSASGASGGAGASGGGGAGGGGATGGGGGSEPCGTPSECAAAWEQAAADKLAELAGGPEDALRAFLTKVPKGGDLHNHLTGAVYAETYLDWAEEDGDCINPDTFVAVYQNQCSASTQPVPDMGAFYDDIVAAWSMEGFVPGGAESGHDHFFATFGKFGAIAGAHREDTLADVAARAADENQLYVETMFNLGKNIGDLSASIWSGTLTASDLPELYDSLVAHPSFQAQVASDAQVVNTARSSYQAVLGCDDISPAAGCEVEMRFIAQVSRTGANDAIFGQLVSAFEMAADTKWIVGANLSSPEDAPASLSNYMLHMAMLDFLHDKYTVPGTSPLQITLHAGELTEEYVPPGFPDATTFHIREAVHTAHARRIGHGLDILSETDSAGLMDDMRDMGVLVEVCLSSNVQILEVSGDAHPLADYIAAGVPVALATDDQGVSRSSMAGEYLRAVLDQQLDYRQLKTMARNSLQHAFLPGEALFASVTDAEPVAACAPTDTMGLGELPNDGCQAFLDGSERARTQWALEGRFRDFESKQ